MVHNLFFFRFAHIVQEYHKMKYKGYTLRSLEQIPQITELDESRIHDMRVVGNVLPFKSNEYVVNELIDWDNIPSDPIFQLTFPQKEMLLDHHFDLMERTLNSTDDHTEIKLVADKIRRELNPHPAGQKEYNLPKLHDHKLQGMQHKYRETILFFPKNGQTCHAYCSFCFRWPQFVHLDDEKFASDEVEILVRYLQNHDEVTDVLFTGGDPMVMSPRLLNHYFRPLIEAGIPNLQTIRIGSKSLSYWPQKYVSEKGYEDVLSLFSDITDSGLNLSFMAHFNHHQELRTDVLKQAVRNIKQTGVQIRTQSPVLNHINAESSIWAKMWRDQVNIGMIPYYMFVVRDTGAQHYFNITLEKAWKIFQGAYNKVSGICRTVRGPSMSATPGKVQISGITELHGQKMFVLRFIQGRNPDWVGKPFFAKYNPTAVWLDDLEPVEGHRFFYEKDMNRYLKSFGEIKLEMINNSAPLTTPDNLNVSLEN